MTQFKRIGRLLGDAINEWLCHAKGVAFATPAFAGAYGPDTGNHRMQGTLYHVNRYFIAENGKAQNEKEGDGNGGIQLRLLGDTDRFRVLREPPG